MSARVSPATPTAIGGSEPPAQKQKKNQEDQIVTDLAPVPMIDPPSEDVEESTGVHVLVVQSPDAPDSPGVALLNSSTATPGRVRELRGWLMVLATVVASITYASGLNPPGGFEKVAMQKPEQDQPIADSSKPILKPTPMLKPNIGDPELPPTTSGEQMIPVLYMVSKSRCMTFYYSNTAAFGLSLSIILLLASQDLHKLAKIKALEILIALDVIALLVAYLSAASFGTLQLVVCAGLILGVPVALLVMSSRLCGNYFWDDL